jgi:NTE family protein
VSEAETPSAATHLRLAQTVLYFAPTEEHFRSFLAAMREVPGCAVPLHADPPYLTTTELLVRFAVHVDLAEALREVRRAFFQAIILDLRNLSGEADHTTANLALASRILEELDQAGGDVEMRYPFHRILTLVASTDGDRADQLVAQLACQGVGRVVRDRSVMPDVGEAARQARRRTFGGLVLQELKRVVVPREVGLTALCCAGGGITGIYFEMGALKCLDDCLSPRGAVNRFDLYFGISAGAVVTSLIANGYSMDELMASIAGHPGGRIPPMSLSLFRLAHLNVRDLARRLGSGIRDIVGALRRAFWGQVPLSFESLVLDYSDLLGPPLKADQFEATLRRLFQAPGATNDFRKLPRPLFIGTTDQDLRAPVLFGDPGYDDIPISQAVQASVSLNPAFSSTLIRGRYYEDGAVTRTTNFPLAIQKGARLLFVLDPFVPYVSKDPGYARQRGLFYNADQNIRTMSYTRFEQVRNYTLRRRPEVRSYTFLPANTQRRLLSVNPMDHRPFLPIWRGAYLSTLQRLTLLRHQLVADLDPHGLHLDLHRAEEVAARLRATENPSFADFFPRGRIEIRRPPLCLEQTPAPPGGETTLAQAF